MNRVLQIPSASSAATTAARSLGQNGTGGPPFKVTPRSWMFLFTVNARESQHKVSEGRSPGRNHHAPAWDSELLVRFAEADADEIRGSIPWHKTLFSSIADCFQVPAVAYSVFEIRFEEGDHGRPR